MDVRRSGDARRQSRRFFCQRRREARTYRRTAVVAVDARRRTPGATTRLVQADLSGEPVTIADGFPTTDATGARRRCRRRARSRTGSGRPAYISWPGSIGPARRSARLATPTAPSGIRGWRPTADVSSSLERLLVIQDLWLLDGARASRLTFDAAQDRHPCGRPTARRSYSGQSRGVRRSVPCAGKWRWHAAPVGGVRPGQDANGWSPDGAF